MLGFLLARLHQQTEAAAVEAEDGEDRLLAPVLADARPRGLPLAEVDVPGGAVRAPDLEAARLAVELYELRELERIVPCAA